MICLARIGGEDVTGDWMNMRNDDEQSGIGDEAGATRTSREHGD